MIHTTLTIIISTIITLTLLVWVIGIGLVALTCVIAGKKTIDI